MTSQERIIAVAALTAVFWTTTLAYAAHPAMPHNAAKLPYEDNVRLLFWLPQGWSFFTRDAREARLVVMRPSGGGWVSASRSPNSRPGNVFGFDRTPRAQQAEAALLLQFVPPDAWAPCEAAVPACLTQRPHSVPVKNPTPHPLYCGRLAFVSQPPIPWAWIDLTPTVVMPSRVVTAEVTC